MNRRTDSKSRYLNSASAVALAVGLGLAVAFALATVESFVPQTFGILIETLIEKHTKP